MREKNKTRLEKYRQMAAELMYEDEAFISLLIEKVRDENTARAIHKKLERKAIKFAEKTVGLSERKAYGFLSKKIRALKEKALSGLR